MNEAVGIPNNFRILELWAIYTDIDPYTDMIQYKYGHT